MEFKSPVLVRLVCWSEVKHGGAFVICIVIYIHIYIYIYAFLYLHRAFSNMKISLFKI